MAGQINISNGVVSASGFANNQAVVDYIKANGSDTASQIAAAKAGATPPAPTTSPSVVGGVAVPQQSGVLNPPVATATLSSAPTTSDTPDFTGASTSPTSVFNIGPTSKSEQAIANSGDQSPQVASVFAINANFIPPPSKQEISSVLADFYRFGKPNQNPDTGEIYEIQPKNLDLIESDDNRASIRVFGFNPKGNSGKGQDQELIPAYSKFILEAVQETHTERSQIVETFGDFYVFFFGERPPMYQFSGTLINTKNVNWVSDFKFYYQNYLRGTKCVENNARVFLTYGGRQIEGFMLGMSTATEATTEPGVKVSFPVVVTRVTYLGFSTDFGFVTKDGTAVMQDASFQALLDQVAGKTGKGTSGAGASQAASALGGVMGGATPAVKMLLPS